MKKGEVLVLYGAGKNVITELTAGKFWGLNPECFCDTDVKKHGTQYIGLPVISLEKVKKTYGNEAKFYITLDTPLRYDVQEELINQGVDKNRIVNYESVSKYRSCHYLKTWMGVGDYSICSCCRSMAPHILWSDTDKTISGALDSYIEVRDEALAAIRSGSPSICGDCHCIEERYWSIEDTVEHFRFHTQLPCQLSCSYCTVVNAKKPQSQQTREFIKWFSLADFVKYLEERELLTKNTRVTVAAVEITIFPKKDEYFDALSKYSICIDTNAVIYDEKIVSITANGKGDICVSVDAGTRETFQKIKGLDAYDKVWKNIKRYTTNGVFVVAKYIFVSENSDDENVEGFIYEAGKAGVIGIAVSADYNRKEPLSDEQIRLIVKMIMMAENRNLSTQKIGIGDFDALESDDSSRIDEFYEYAKSNSVFY